MLNADPQPTFRAFTTIGRKLVDAFAALHATGLCYRDISFGNLRVDPPRARSRSSTWTTSGSTAGSALVKGTGRFMAPEVLRDEAPRPRSPTCTRSPCSCSTCSCTGIRSWARARTRPTTGRASGLIRRPTSWCTMSGSTAVRVRPRRPGEPAGRTSRLTWWPIYPQQFRRVFTQAFTMGLHEASLPGRVTESTWRRALLSLHDSVAPCPACGAAAFYDQERPDQRCWGCHQPLPVPAPA